MAGRLTCLLAGVMLGICSYQVAGIGGFTEFLNGISFDIDELLEDVHISTSPMRERRRKADRMFREADINIRRDRREMNFRSIFSHSTGHEFLDAENSSEIAEVGLEWLAALVDETGLDTAESFDADGNSIDPGVMQVSSLKMGNCPYDKANGLPCNDTFKEPTGRCSNVMDGKKTWGMAGTPYSRVLAAKYEDGIGARRLTEFKSGGILKSPRVVSTAVTTNDIVLNFDGFNAQIMQWGQFITHEFTHLAETEVDAACCPDQIFAARNTEGAEPTAAQRAHIREEIREDRGDVCMQIEIEDDPVHEGYVCMTQTRSKSAALHDCSIGLRQQMNSITHVFDGSVIYGSSKSEQDALRTFSGGLMKTQVVNGATLPPQDLESCPAAARTVSRCPFKGGDTRINTTPNLMSIHTASIILHNAAAEDLSVLNSHWDDERLYQEARRIMSSIEGSIHYYEYLPLILGDRLLKKYKLDSYAGFDSSVNPSVVSEMAHAAMRFGHSTVGGFFSVIKDNGTSDFVNLQPNFFNTDLLYQGGFKQCIKGLQRNNPWIIDRNFPTQMRDFLFDSKRDIISLNINRGRDHGLQSYTDYRRHYGLSVPRSFDDLQATNHSQAVIDELRKIYTSVEDVELYVGGVTEGHVEGGLVGELFANILGDGFSRLIKGDRLWFEGPNSGLSADQMKAIKDYKYHQFLCHGADLEKISDNAYLIAGQLGATEVLCSSLPKLNLALWREQSQATPECIWEIVRESPCCRGEKEIEKRCVEEAGCMCVGEKFVTRKCKCRGQEGYRNIVKRCGHKWGNRHQG